MRMVLLAFQAHIGQNDDMLTCGKCVFFYSLTAGTPRGKEKEEAVFT